MCLSSSGATLYSNRRHFGSMDITVGTFLELRGTPRLPAVHLLSPASIMSYFSVPVAHFLSPVCSRSAGSDREVNSGTVAFCTKQVTLCRLAGGGKGPWLLSDLRMSTERVVVGFTSAPDYLRSKDKWDTWKSLIIASRCDSSYRGSIDFVSLHTLLALSATVKIQICGSIFTVCLFVLDFYISEISRCDSWLKGGDCLDPLRRRLLCTKLCTSEETDADMKPRGETDS